MAWNQPGEEKKRPPRGGPDDSSLDDLLRRWQRRVQQLWRPGSGRGSAVLALAGVVLVVWIGSGIYQIDANERGVIQRFGRFVAVEQPGHGWHWPYPIETLKKVNVATTPIGTDDKAQLLTADQNLVDVSWSVQYRIADPVRFLFNVRDQVNTLRELSGTAIRELIAQQDLASLLAGGEAHVAVTSQAQSQIQRALDAYQAGVVVTGVNITDLQLPDAVLAAQRDAVKADEERKRVAEDAQGYANDILPKAEAVAQRQLADAEVYAKQTVADADGEAERFNQLVNAYTLAPDIMRSRMYTETMEEILTRSHKIVLDTNGAGGSVIYLPLDKLADAMRTAPAAGSSNSSGSSASAGGSNAAAGQPPAAAAATSPPPASATPATSGDENDRDDQEERGRERPER
ncbi:MAG TPA: FtsH protease activity modulator HflK [Steroidobacteraceae bacterium]|jgi:membrane protease subunit HflK|nr:FtsH protease activity modulator HflK [Steroidobacteraceae bacterium]